MSRKRRNTSSPESEEHSLHRRAPSKSLFSEDVDASSEQPSLHPDTGQVNAFPGLETSEETFYGPALNGIDYLRMVRSEAKGVPSLLHVHIDTTTPESTVTSDLGHGQFGDGFYAVRGPTKTETAKISSAHARYYETLLLQFKLLQATLRCTPPADAESALEDVRTISFHSDSIPAREAWERHISRHNPHPVQVACMGIDSVFHLIDLLTEKLMKTQLQEHDLGRVCTWAWAMMGRLPDRGELGGDEISQLRQLAMAAAGLSKDEQEISGASSPGERPCPRKIEPPPVLIGRKNEDHINSREPPAISQRKMTEMLGLILLTLVGEVYGQRDLLALRETWAIERDLAA